MELERKKALLVKSAYYLMAAAAVYIAARWLWWMLLPFLAGFLIAWALRPFVGFICRHSKITRKWASIAAAFVFYAVLAVIIWLLCAWLLLQAEEFFTGLPRLYKEKIEPALAGLNEWILGLASRFAPRYADAQVFEGVNTAINGLFFSAYDWCSARLAGFAKSLPMAALTLVFTVLASVLICADYSGVTKFVMAQIPQRLHLALLEVRDFLAGTILRICKAYMILAAIAFLELAAGLWFLGFESFLTVAAVIAFLDMLPVLGSGMVMIPWGIFLIATGRQYVGSGVLLLWVIVTVVHEILEPRVLGGQIGLHPLATLTAMYFGLRLAGLGGMIIMPIACLLIRYLNEKGYIRLYKPPS